MCHGFDNPRRHRVSHPHKDNRHGPSRRHGGPRWSFATGEDQVHAPDAQRPRVRGEHVDISLAESDLEDHVPALLQPGRLESGPESL
jgi:hypothetical protein